MKLQHGVHDVDVIEAPSPEELKLFAGVLADAMASDPVHRWCSTRADTRGDIAYFRFFLRQVIQRGWVLASDPDRVAVAVWCPPDRCNDLKNEPPRLLPDLVSQSRRSERAVQYFGVAERAHPDEEHGYLGLMGVRSAAQGAGVGSRVLGRLLEDCARRGAGAWTWSSNPRNYTFYERNGFHRRGALGVPDGAPQCESLWRPHSRVSDT